MIFINIKRFSLIVIYIKTKVPLSPQTSKQVASNKVSSRVFGMSFDEHGKYFVTVGVRFVKFWYFDTNDDKKVSSYR